MNKPDISIFGSAARPENWPLFHRSLGTNDLEFEIVFVGPNPPKERLPDNFKYIRSNVKPAQCFEIAARQSSGELLMWTADDSLFVTPSPLDKLYRTYLDCEDENVLVSSNYDLPEGWDRFYSGDMSSPTTALNGLMSARLWRRLGGIDRKFIALGWDIDIDMRIHAMGGSIVMSDVYMDKDVEAAHKPRSRGSTLLRDHKSTDIALLHALWTKDGRIHFERAAPFEPFSDSDILIRSQEPRGRWRYQNDLINRLMTSSVFYTLKGVRESLSGRAHRFEARKIFTYLKHLSGRN